MSLSEHDQQVLREMEQSLYADDPNFGRVIGRGSGFSRGMIPQGSLNLRGVALIVVGLLVMVGGVALAQNSLWFVILSILGFLIMFGAGIWMLRGGGASPRQTSRGLRRNAEKGKRPHQGNSRVSRLEDNFRRRFEER